MISPISIWEICLLVQKKKVHFTQSLQQTLNIIHSMTELESIPIDNRIAELSQTLPGSFHKDPADRFIVATARHLGATLITKDVKIRKYKHVKTLW
jgi:PIN domain nuclease of toxin-antitoxin system